MASSLFTFLKNKAFELSLGLTIVSIFFNVNILIHEADWGMGFANPYSSIFLNSFDLMVFLSGLFFILSRKKIKNIKHCFLPLAWILAANFSLFLSPFEALHQLMLFIKISTLFLFFILLLQANKMEIQNGIKLIILTISAQAAIGIAQFLTQSDLNLQILGEPILHESGAFLSKISIGNVELIRAYGTFAHPNILGGIISIGIFLLSTDSSFSKSQKIPLMTLLALGLLFSFSRSAALALACSFTILFMKKNIAKMDRAKKLSLLLFTILITTILASRGISILSDPALIERFDGFKIAFALIQNHPFGLGFTAYTHFLNEIALTPLAPWQYQPIHNIYILIFAEFGLTLALILGGLSFYFFKKTLKIDRINLSLLSIILVIACFDHYFFSLDIGRTMIVLITAIIFIRKEVESHEIAADQQ